MYMTDINTTLRGNQEQTEDPKKPNVIAKKIFTGYCNYFSSSHFYAKFLAIASYYRNCKLYV